jgi:putative ABC transport system permease protein
MTPYRNPRFQMLVLGSFAALALLMTALGAFSVVAFLAVHRRQEMGIRLALGARPSSVARLLAKQMLVPVLIGIALGFALIPLASQLIRSQLYVVETSDPATILAAASTVIAASLAAAYLPARRAARLDPLLVLRD